MVVIARESPKNSGLGIIPHTIHVFIYLQTIHVYIYLHLP